MEIRKEDLELRISRNAIERYKNYVKGNFDEDYKLLKLKLRRNWILGKTIELTDETETRNYGNLILERNIENNVLTRLFNSTKTSKCFNDDIQESKKYKKEVEDILGITRLKGENNADIDGCTLSDRAYRYYIKENDTYLSYKELLRIATNVITEGIKLRSFNDKVIYQLDNIKVTVTLREGVCEITNIMGLGGEINE